jgi:outer membrane protein assembly factor BamB
MRHADRERLVTGIVVLLGALVAIGLAVHRFESRPHAGGLLAFDLKSGEPRFAVTAQTASVHLHAVGPGVVVVTGADDCNLDERETMYAYSLPAGVLLWQRALRDACSDYGPLDPVSDGIVAVATSSGLQGWRARDGSTQWRNRVFKDTPRQTTNAVVSVSSDRGLVHYLDPRSGHLERVALAQSEPYPWLVTPKVTVLVTQSTDAPDFRQQLTAIDPTSGQRVWRQTIGGNGGLAAPAAADGVTVVGWAPPYRMNVRMTYGAYDVRTGRRLWLRRQPASSNGPPDELEAIGSGIAVFVRVGMLSALDLRSGAVRWRRQLTGWRAGYSQVVAAEGSVAVIDQGRVTVLRASDGDWRWSAALATDGLRLHFPAAISGGLLIIPATSSGWTPYDE